MEEFASNMSEFLRRRRPLLLRVRVTPALPVVFDSKSGYLSTVMSNARDQRFLTALRKSASSGKP